MTVKFLYLKSCFKFFVNLYYHADEIMSVKLFAKKQTLKNILFNINDFTVIDLSLGDFNTRKMLIILREHFGGKYFCLRGIKYKGRN